MTKQTHLLEEDEISRQQALALDSFIVEAPAGAGKTELLTQRYLKLLQTVQSPEEIIAITFTNKAAAEMRVRIFDSLTRVQNGELPDKPHKQITFDLSRMALQRSQDLGWKLLQNPSRLRIYTIDSLSSNLARQMPLMSRFGAQPAVTDDARLHFAEAATRTLALLDEGSAAAEVIGTALAYFDNDTFKLNNLLVSMLGKRDQWMSYTHAHDSAQESEAALKRLIGQDIQATADFLPARLQNLLMPIARFAATNLDCEAPIALLRDWETAIPATTDALFMWRAVSDLLLTSSGTLRKRFDKNMGLPATPEAKPFKESLTEIVATLQATSGAEEALANLRLLPQAKHSDEAWKMIAALAQLLNLAAANLWVVFQEHNEVDFIEIAQRALTALEDESGNPTDLALKLDYRIQHLLVDEFQDTSPSQVKLLNHLTQGWMPGDGRTLFAVGDPMQSIYRFRKANVGLFLRVAAEGVGQLSLTNLRLWRNNRSCPPVVDWVNHAFGLAFPKLDNSVRGAISYRQFVATKAGETGAGVQIHPIVASTGELADEGADSVDAENAQGTGTGTGAGAGAGAAAEDKNSLREREANTIIRIIQSTREQHPDAKIAVLVRARNHLTALVTEIRRNHPGLFFQAVEIEALAGRQSVQDVLSLTYAMHHLADRVHWLAILRAPWCGLKLADLHALACNDSHSTIFSLMHNQARLQAMSEDGRARLLHVREILVEALAHKGRQTPSRWVHGVWLMLGGADCLWESGDVRDVQAFFQLISKLEAGNQFSIEELAAQVLKLYAAPAAEADERLQFMTIHKSKGLEFDTVILPGLDRKANGNDQPLVLWEEVAKEHGDAVDLVAAPLIPKGAKKDELPTPYDYLKRLEKERDNHESARLLYVAATRAERCLHLVGVAQPNAKGELQAPKNSFLSLLWPVVGADFMQAEAPSSAQMQPANGQLLADFISKLVRLAQPAMPAILSQREVNEYAIAPVTLAKSTEAKGDTEAAGSAENKLDADIGTLAHKYLEIIARQGLEAWSAARVAGLKSAMQRWLHSQGHGDDEAVQGANRVVTALQATLASEHGQWVLQARPDAAAELAMVTAADGGNATHVIDRTFVEDGIRWIIDYKSVPLALETTDAGLTKVAERYRPQLARYAALFKHENMPVKQAVFFMNVGKLVVLSS